MLVLQAAARARSLPLPACLEVLCAPPSVRVAAVDIHGHTVYTGSLMGKVTLVVNVASHCGYTGGWAAQPPGC